jgi:hypothetical protein
VEVNIDVLRFLISDISGGMLDISDVFTLSVLACQKRQANRVSCGTIS